MLFHPLRQLLVSEHRFYTALRIVKISPDADNRRVCSALRNHLLLLDRADAVLRVKHDNARARDIREACKCRLAGISGGGCQDNNLLLRMVFLCRCRQQMRQNGKRHILERNRRAVKQLKIIYSVLLPQRGDLLRIKLAVVSPVDAALQLLLRKIGQKQLHHLVSHLLITHLCQPAERDIKRRYSFRHEKSPVRCQSF